MTNIVDDLLNIRVEFLNNNKIMKNTSIPVKIIWQNNSSYYIKVCVHKNGVLYFAKDNQDIDFGELVLKHNVEFELKANEKIEENATIKVLKSSGNHLNGVNNIELKLIIPLSIKIEGIKDPLIIRVNRLLKDTQS